MGDLLKINTLGGLAIQREGVPVTGFVSRKVEALLVYLACDRREHPREVLAEMLWNDLSQDRSMANLRMALSSLQQQLAPFFVVTRQTVALNPEREVCLDVRELEAGIDAAEQLWSRPNGKLTAPVAARLQESLSLYRGNFLAGFHLRDSRNFEDWMVMEQERLRRRTIDAMFRLSSHFLEKGAFAEGIAQVNKLLQIDPLWEAAHRLLMMLLARSGQTAAALTQYENCCQILKDELDVDPDEETTKLLRLIQNGKINMTTETTAPQYNLPLSPTPFVDRPQERKRISERLDHIDCRLLTLIGAGGIGKTRLAIQSAYERTGDYRHGVFFVALNTVSAPHAIPSAIATSLKIPVEVETPEEVVLKSLQDKELLLVLDNFEHLLEGVEFISRMLATAPQVKILVTSRERLNIEEEWLLPVDGLPFPEFVRDEHPDTYSAVQLFLQNARRVQPEFVFEDNRIPVIRICQLVEGLPLGLELAAAWLRLMPCEQIAEHIVRDLDFLKTSLRNVPERHRSIRVLFDHSWLLLSPVEQTALMKLSVFRGNFSIEAAQDVAGASLPVLVPLIEKSLVQVETSGRYDMHELLRRFAYEKLIEQSLDKSTHLDQYRFYHHLVRDCVFDNREQDLFVEHANFISVLEWLYKNGYHQELLNFAGELTFYWMYRGYLREGHSWLERAVSVNNANIPLEIQAKAFGGAGILNWRVGNYDEACQQMQQALAAYRELDQKLNIAKMLNYLGYVFLHTARYSDARNCYEEILSIGYELENDELTIRALGNLGLIASEVEDWSAARSYTEQSLTMARKAGDRHTMAVLLNTLGTILMHSGEYIRARTAYEETLQIFRELEDISHIPVALANLGEISHRSGQLDQAFEQYRESSVMLLELGDTFALTMMIENFACLAVDQEEPELTALLFGAAEAARSVLGAPVLPRERHRYDEFIEQAKIMLDDTNFTAAWDKGCAMTLEQALHRALQRD